MTDVAYLGVYDWETYFEGGDVGGGGSSGLQILTYDFAFDTPNLQDPNDGWGVAALTVPVGSYVELEVLTLIPPDAAVSLYAALGEADSSAPGFDPGYAGMWTLTMGLVASEAIVSTSARESQSAYAPGQPKSNFSKSVTADTIYLATVNDGSPMTQGSWRLVAKVYTP